MWLLYCEKSRDKASEGCGGGGCSLQFGEARGEGTGRWRCSVGGKKGKRRRRREIGVGIRVFRESLWSGADMGTHSGSLTKRACPSLPS